MELSVCGMFRKCCIGKWLTLDEMTENIVVYAEKRGYKIDQNGKHITFKRVRPQVPNIISAIKQGKQKHWKSYSLKKEGNKYEITKGK